MSVGAGGSARCVRGCWFATVAPLGRRRFGALSPWLLVCGRRSFGAPACLVRSDSPRLRRNWRGCQPVVTDWHCAPAFLAGCGTRSARHAAPPFRDGRMNAHRHALVRSDRAVLVRAAWGVAKAARPMSMDGGCWPRRATDEERARSRVERARPRGKDPRERKDEPGSCSALSRAGGRRLRRGSARRWQQCRARVSDHP